MPPTSSPAYSVELVQSCRGKLQYTGLRCPAQPNDDPNGPQATRDVVTVLTISPPVRPSAPRHGQKFDYDLIARASINNRQTLNCAVVQATGTWVSPDGRMTSGPDCPGGATKTDWKFCLGCSAQSGPIYTSESRNACFLPDAVNAAAANRPSQSCWMQNQGVCPP